MKNTLKILVAGAIFGTVLAGCGTPEEGNTPPTNDAAGKSTNSNLGTPGTDATTGSTANTPAANTPAPDANATNK